MSILCCPVPEKRFVSVSTQTRPLPAECMAGPEIDSSCDDCHLEQMEVNERLDNMNVTLIFLIVEMVLGLMVLIVEVAWEVCTLYIHHYLEHNGCSGMRRYLVITRFTYATIVAFPLIVIPIILVAIVITKRITSYIVLIILVCLWAFLMYFFVGLVVMVEAYEPWVSLFGTYFFGILAILTAIVYLLHLIYELQRVRKNNNGDEL